MVWRSDVYLFRRHIFLINVEALDLLMSRISEDWPAPLKAVQVNLSRFDELNSVGLRIYETRVNLSSFALPTIDIGILQ